MKKRMLSAVMAMVLAAAMLAGCGSAPAPAASSAAPGAADAPGTATSSSTAAKPSTGEKKKMRYTGWGSPNEKKTTQHVLDMFMQNNPDVEVEYIHIPTDYVTKVTTMITANQGPDVALLQGDTGIMWAEEGKMQNIVEFIDKDPNVSLDDILPQVVYWWDEGKAIGVNGALEVFGLFYNKDILAAAGIEVPTTAATAWTWEEFVNVCQRLTVDNNGKNATEAGFDPKNIKQFGILPPATWAAFPYGNAYSGESFLNEDETKLNLVNSKSSTAVQNIADLINKYHVAPSAAQSKNIPNGSMALASKKAAMMWDGQWALQDLSMNKVNFGVGIPPKMYDKPMTIALGDPIAAFASTKYPQEAYELQKAFMNPEYTMELIETGLWMPILKEWYTDPALIDKWARNNPAHPEGYVDAIMTNGFENGIPVHDYTVRNLPKIKNILLPALDRVWLGQATVDEAIAAVEDKANAEVKGLIPRP